MTVNNTIKGTLLLSASLTSMSALAQVGTLEEIIVTAQKRQESSQEVPIAIQTLSGDSLANAGISTTDDLGLVTPGLNVQQSGVGNTMFLRGLGNQDATAGQDGSVAVYVDGVWYGGVTGSALTLNNIERLEVLKGPQGTLFGRNTTGGVINVITKDPTEEPSGEVSVSYGNYERARASFYGSRGITENIAADLSLLWSDQGEGYGTNLTTGKDVNKREDEYNIRSKWKYSGENTDVTFIVGYEDFYDDMGYVRGVPKGYIDFGGGTSPSDTRDILNTTDSYAEFENQVVSLRVDHGFEAFDFVSITGYKKDTLDSFTDNDYSVLDLLDAAIDFDNEAVTQEFQFISNSDSSIRWIAGLFFLDSQARSDIVVSGGAIWANPDAPFLFNDQRFVGTIDTNSYAGFGEVAFDVADNQSLTLGLRYSYDEREIQGMDYLTSFTGVKFAGTAPLFPGPAAVNGLESREQKDYWKEPTWRVVYDIQLNNDVLLYASYNRGFRSGNYNAVAPSDPAFEPEFVDAYEVGFKSDLADGMVRLNGALFFYDIEDMQLQRLEGTTTSITNATKAEILGAEFDLTWLVTDSFTMILGASALDSEYKDWTDAAGYTSVPSPGVAPTAISSDVSGNQLIKAPELEVSLGLIYSITNDSGTYTSDLRAGYNDGFPFEPDGRLVQDSYTLVNWNLSWKSSNETWGVNLQGKNLLDEEYSVHTASSGLGDFYASAPPRTFSVTGTYSF